MTRRLEVLGEDAKNSKKCLEDETAEISNENILEEYYNEEEIKIKMEENVDFTSYKYVFNSPKELKNRLLILKIDSNSKIAKKYRHSGCIYEKRQFFNLERQSTKEILSNSTNQVKFQEGTNDVFDNDYKINVDAVVYSTTYIQALQNVNATSDDKILGHQSSILSKYKLGKSSTTNMENYINSIVSTSECKIIQPQTKKWGVDLHNPDFNFVEFFELKKKFVKMNERQLCETRTGEDIRASGNFI